MELVIAGDDLDQPGAGGGKDGEVADQGQKTPLGEEALQQGAQLRRAIGRDRPAIHRPPGHEALAVGGQGADPRLEAVGDHQHGVGAKERRDLVLVGLELVEGPVQGGVLVPRVLQLHHGQGQAVDKDHHIRAAFALVLDDRELIDRQPVVVLQPVEVDQPGLVTADAAVRAGDLDIHALDDQPVQATVFLDERRCCGLPDLLDHLRQGLGGQVRVDPRQGGAQPVVEDDVAIARPLRGRAVRGDSGPRQDGITEIRQPGQRGRFDLTFVEWGGHGSGPSAIWFVSGSNLRNCRPPQTAFWTARSMVTFLSPGPCRGPGIVRISNLAQQFQATYCLAQSALGTRAKARLGIRFGHQRGGNTIEKLANADAPNPSDLGEPVIGFVG